MSGAVMMSGALTPNLGNDLHQLFAYHFMVNAYRAGTVVAVVAGVMGWFMVLRRQAFVGHTLAVVTFPGAAGAALLGVSVTLGYFAAAIAAALVIALVPRSSAGSASSEEPAVVGTVQAFALACGALFASLSGGFLNSVTGLLFGTFLGISDGQVVALVVLAVAALGTLALVGRPLLFSTVDPDVARARGLPVRAISTVFIVLLGCAAAEASQITGALLVFALLVMPAAAAQQVTVRPALGLAVSVALALGITWLGLAVAYFSIYPVGFTVTTIGMITYLAAVTARLVRARMGRRLGVAPAVAR